MENRDTKETYSITVSVNLFTFIAIILLLKSLKMTRPNAALTDVNTVLLFRNLLHVVTFCEFSVDSIFSSQNTQKNDY